MMLGYIALLAFILGFTLATFGTFINRKELERKYVEELYRSQSKKKSQK